jgi:hypothetical protein
MDGGVPKVMCPGCQREMRLMTAEPSIVPELDTLTFHCDGCGTETKREIKRREKEPRG